MKTNTAIILSALSLALAACSNTSPAPQQEVAELPKSDKTNFSPEIWPQREPSPALVPAIEDRVSKLVAKMTVEEKVGQIIQPELKYVTPQDVKTYHLGSILNGGGTTPNNDKRASVDDWVSMAEAFYQASMDTSDGKLAIPLIWGSDAVHGHNNLFGATIFPHNIGLGAANDPELIRRIGQATAKEMAASGLDWTFGPTVAVVRDVRWGRTYESYSEAPDIVSAYAKEMVKGIQGGARTSSDFKPGYIVATAKHFLGDGGTLNGIDRGDTQVSEQELLDIHAAGYISALDSHVLTTMASFNSWNGDRMHGHEYLLTDILKERMGFTGFVVGDWNGHQHVPNCTSVKCAAAINAGLDMFMVPEDWKPLWENTLKDVKEGQISMARLDDAVTRILRVKMLAGLFDAGPIRNRQHVGDETLVGHPDHRAVAREAVRKSLVLLKNDNQVLPIKGDSNILVLGDAADNIGKQSGGWTLTWQGTGNSNEDFPGASSILDGLNELVQKHGGQVAFDQTGETLPELAESGSLPDVAVMVYGEEPYAEWHGDIVSIEYQYNRKQDLELLAKLKELEIPVVSVFITGRPLWTNKELNASDAFVVAWLPGSEGGGVADVLVADANGNAGFDFQGRLSFSWPATANQAIVNMGQDDYDPLFEYGYGLALSDQVIVGNSLSEETSKQTLDEMQEQWIFVSRVNAPWNLTLHDQKDSARLVDANTVRHGEGDNISIIAVDKVSQEDSRRVAWMGLRPARVAFNADVPQNFSEFVENGAHLNFDVRLDKALPNTLSLSMGCESGCSSALALSELLDSPSQGMWYSVSVPLSCMADSSVDYSSVNTVFSLQSSEQAELTFANIKIVPTEAGQPANCGLTAAN